MVVAVVQWRWWSGGGAVVGGGGTRDCSNFVLMETLNH